MRSLSNQDFDDISDAIRAARMIAEVVGRTVREGMSRPEPDGPWQLENIDANLLDYFTGAQLAALEVVATKFAERAANNGGKQP